MDSRPCLPVQSGSLNEELEWLYRRRVVVEELIAALERYAEEARPGRVESRRSKGRRGICARK